MNFTWHADANHSWLAVPVSMIDVLDLSFDSYTDGQGMAYLEEDVDAPSFLRTLPVGMYTLSQEPDPINRRNEPMNVRYIIARKGNKEATVCLCGDRHATAANAARCAGLKRAIAGACEVRCVDGPEPVTSWRVDSLENYGMMLRLEQEVRDARAAAKAAETALAAYEARVAASLQEAVPEEA